MTRKRPADPTTPQRLRARETRRRTEERKRQLKELYVRITAADQAGRPEVPHLDATRRTRLPQEARSPLLPGLEACLLRPCTDEKPQPRVANHGMIQRQVAVGPSEPRKTVRKTARKEKDR